MEDTIVSFEVAKLAKEKKFSLECLYFYTKPNSKMFGIDEQGRTYPILNVPRKLYKCGENAVLSSINAYYAPTQSLLQKWLREVHSIYIGMVYFDKIDTTGSSYWEYRIHYKGITGLKDTYEEALEAGLNEALRLI